MGTDQVRAKVLAGAPFAVEFSVTPVNGTLDGGATELSVAAGAVDGTAVTVTRTAGTTAAVTVDVDLTTQPTLPLNHTGYEFAKSTSNLPATILPDTTNAAPAFTSPETFGVAENQTAVGTVEASDDDMDDEVTGYALNGGADQALFSIGSTSGVLTFQAAPNYEDPQDANTDNAYVVVVRATSGTGARVKTADQTITVTVMDVAEQTVTIVADQAAFTATLDDVTFTLTRTEDPAAALDVAVVLTQDQDLLESANLAQTVTFRAGKATAKLIIQNNKFVDHMVTENEATLTATVQDGTGYEPGSPNTASTRIVVADPAVTAWIEATAYTFAEDATGNDATIAVILRTATGVPSPNLDIYLSFSTAAISGQAESGVDYENMSLFLRVFPADFTQDGTEFTARKEVTLVIVDDAIDEPDETLTVKLERSVGDA